MAQRNPKSPPGFQTEIPLETEALANNRDLFTRAVLDPKQAQLIIHLDVRERNWHKVLRLPRGRRINWDNVHTTQVQELSCFLFPIIYQITVGDPWYRDREGQRCYFGVGQYLKGIDLQRGVTTVTLRAAVLLCVIAGIGVRQVVWLMSMLFHITTSKSSLDRWLKEVAGQLPGDDEMVRLLNAEKEITEGHLDEIFPRGWRKGCVLVLRDEHGRIVATRQVEERTKKQVKPFLERLKRLGLKIQSFYVDGCKAYKEAIREVYPEANLQYDYFHILQNIWRKLYRMFVRHRKEVKRRSEKAETDWYKAKLKRLAEKLWKNRGLIFKAEEKLTDEERARLVELMDEDRVVDTVRGFLARIWGIFRDSEGELGARQRLGKLKQRVEVKAGTAYAKAVAFLEDRFEDMVTFLRIPGVKRNSLAESGIRVLRRLEQGHDGFRGDDGRRDYLRLYQAIKYCGWTVYRMDGGLGLLPRIQAIDKPRSNGAAAE